MTPGRTAKAAPVKEFFIRMVTRDISLHDCILDLLDNCLDGARRQIREKDGASAVSGKYVGYKANIKLGSEVFEIVDNCGGIPVHNAENYAFHFGRRHDAPSDADAIGLYGIGMKRAILKIGKKIEITSYTSEQGFKVSIDVPEWEKNEQSWDFDLELLEPAEPGTSIKIWDFNEGIRREFEDVPFKNRLKMIVARDYSFFLQDGFKASVNDIEVEPYLFKLRESEEFKPVKMELRDDEDNDVLINITAGMAALPPADDSADSPDMKLKEVDYYGWFVSCNDRIVLAGNKDDKTVWGNENFTRWHPQYYGFMGILAFHSSDPIKLPWDTTKRDLDITSPLYRRAIARMKTVTQQWVTYTTARKMDLETAKKVEEKTEPIPVKQISESSAMVLPTYTKPNTIWRTITYFEPEDKVKKMKKQMGQTYMSNREMGERTFDYYWENEVEE